MKDQFEYLVGIVKSARRFAWHGVAAAWVVAVLGALAILSLPNMYQSRAQIYVDTRSVLRPLLQGLAVSPQIQDQTDAVRRAMLAHPSLDAVAKSVGLYAENATPEARERELLELSEHVSIRGDSANGFYTITYTGTSAEQSRQVVQTLLDNFQQASVGAGTSDTENAQSFLAQQVADYERRLSESEQKLAEFKKQNVGLMPDQRGDYFARLQATQANLEKVRADLAVAESQRDLLARKLAGETGNSSATSAPPVPPTALEVQEATVLDSRIRDVRRQIDDLLVKYTDRHPDVIAARATLAQLEAQRRGTSRSVIATNGTAPSDRGGTPVDAVVQNLQIAYNAADVQVAALRSQLAQATTSVAELRRLVTTGPEVEAELARLNRDYGVTKAQYEALLQRYENARLSSDATKSEELRFKILEPPKAPLAPVSPNRRLFMIGMLFAAIGAGLAVAVGMSFIRPVFLTRSAAASALGLPVIGVVRLIRTGERRTREWRSRLVFLAACVALMAFVLTLSMVSYPASRALAQLLHGGA